MCACASASVVALSFTRGHFQHEDDSNGILNRTFIDSINYFFALLDANCF